jgi:hypothetical protein
MAGQAGAVYSLESQEVLPSDCLYRKKRVIKKGGKLKSVFHLFLIITAAAGYPTLALKMSKNRFFDSAPLRSE